MLNFIRKKEIFFPEDEVRLIVKAIRHAEHLTSGEVRVYVESRCSWMNALDRAKEVFFSLKMDKTDQRNAVLVYVAIKDRQMAVFGDEGIHKKVGEEYWNKVVLEMMNSFHHKNYAEGISNAVVQIGDALKTNFPYNKDSDKNELPDGIVFGR